MHKLLMTDTSRRGIILIKLGGSIITNKAEESTAAIDKIEQLAGELKKAIDQTGYTVILAHGAGSFGHPQAKRYQTANGYIDQGSLMGFAMVKQSVSILNTLVINELIKANLPAVTYSPMSSMTSHNRVSQSIFLEPLEILLDRHMLPVVHGDVIPDAKHGWTIYSGETILNNIAVKLLESGHRLKMMIEVGNTSGVYDDKGETIPEINANNFHQIEKFLSGSANADVTGGMLHKVQEAVELSNVGIPTYIISTKTENLYNAITGTATDGTVIR